MNRTDISEAVAWRIDHHGGWDYQLVNLTNTRKYDVGVEREPVCNTGGETHLGEAAWRESVELDVFLAMQTRDRRITASWRPMPDHTGDRWTQRIGLP